ncbi:MAG: type IV toxin-antitoxin system AbiEi family antitoxin domain-containing protein [Candidatus Delongbacteria bacterium]|jgi:predicted transcriptional regulator of viral defense system|nr:type IV toxin-antitoxin system AbiEi family antitoxin domain-containing protein [Candidatus Delongbacteria bacterium]
MKIKFDKNIFVDYFKNQKSFSNKEIYNYFVKLNPDVKKSTVNWRISHLVSKGVLTRIGRGIYTLGAERKFVHSITNKERNISKDIIKNYPYLKHCIWNLSAIKEFLQHIISVNFTIVEIEREAVQSVYNHLKGFNANVFLEPSEYLLEDHVINLKNSIIVKSLVSESPVTLQEKVPVPDLEKILVDIVSEKELFYFLQGNEKINIFQNAIDKYTINYDKLKRYAKRRNSYDSIATTINQINGNKL